MRRRRWHRVGLSLHVVAVGWESRSAWIHAARSLSGQFEEAMMEQEAVSEEAAVEIGADGDEAFGKAKESLELTFPDRGSKPAVKKVKEA